MSWKMVVLASVATVAITVAFIIKETEVGGLITGLTALVAVILGVKKARRNNG